MTTKAEEDDGVGSDFTYKYVFLPPLQGEGWGGDGVYCINTSSYPIPLLTSPLKGEEEYAKLYR